MFKKIAITPETVTHAAQSGEESRAKAASVFKTLFGLYGNLFLNKFSTGQQNSAGDDVGILSARGTWGYALRDYSEDTIASAMSICLDRHPEFPPSLPQFVILCRAAAPRKVYRPAVPEIEMSQGLRSQFARKAREINAKHAQDAVDKVTGYVARPMSLDGLKQGIAQAVGLAGGDECRVLLDLDRAFAPRGVA